MSLNDPHWGNRGSNGDRGGKRGDEQGPPDLEEIWRDFNQRLSGIFGGRREKGPSGPGGNGGGGPALPSSRNFGRGMGLLVLLVLVVWLGRGFYTVDTNERGIVLRLGTYHEVTQPGLRWRLPWPIESHETVDFTGLRTVPVGYDPRGNARSDTRDLMLTQDLNIVTVQFDVQYDLKKELASSAKPAPLVEAPLAKPAPTAEVVPVAESAPVAETEPTAETDLIAEPVPTVEVAPTTEPAPAPVEIARSTKPVSEEERACKLIEEPDGLEVGPRRFIFCNREPNEEFVRQIAETAIREIVGKNTMNSVLNVGREQIALETQNLIQRMLDHYNSGIQVSRVTMRQVQPPEQVQAAFSDVIRAGQDKERQENEGEAYKNSVIPVAKGREARLLAEANAYRASVVAKAKGEADRFTWVLSEFKRAPQVTRERMYLEAVQDVLSKSSKVMVDNKGSNNLLYLPLDKLIQQPGGRAVASTAGIAASEPAQATLPQPQTSSQDTPRDRELSRNRTRGDR